jgi:hypothetical protein
VNKYQYAATIWLLVAMGIPYALAGLRVIHLYTAMLLGIIGVVLVPFVMLLI